MFKDGGIVKSFLYKADKLFGVKSHVSQVRVDPWNSYRRVIAFEVDEWTRLREDTKWSAAEVSG